MPLRVAFDLDGTVADMTAGLRREAESLFGADRAPAPSRPHRPEDDAEDDGDLAVVAPELSLSARQRSRLWEHVATLPNFWGGLPEMQPGMVARIAETARTRRWEVIFLTKRPVAGSESIQLQSQQWLADHGFPLPSVFVVQGSRGKIADALDLDAVVDDRPENCVDVAAESHAKAILIWSGDAAAISSRARRLGIRVTRTIAEAVSVLEQLDDLQNSGMLRSIKKLFRQER